MAPPKAKGQKMNLGEFLTDTSLGSWADEMEDAPIPSGSRSSGYGGADRSFGSGGGFASSTYTDKGYSVREALPLPSKPPYTVHLGNMSFDATEGDIQDFFSGCQVTSVRIVEDKIERKPKGFGYAEFATLEGLKKALEYNGTQFQGRNIRVSVAEPQKDRPDARDISDWSRKGPLPELTNQRRVSDRPSFGDRERGFGAGRSFDNASDAGSERPSRRPAYEQADGKVRDLGNWERKGPLTPTLPPGAPAAKNTDRPSSHDGPQLRKNSPAWGEGQNRNDGRSQEGSRPPRREFVEKPILERAPTAAEADNEWRSKMRPDPPAKSPAISPTPSAKELSVPSSPIPAAAPAPLASRPKLNLQKRTVSQAEPSPGLGSAVSDTRTSLASPFGAARPIDTSAREKEIEDKLRLKKEQDDKAREEKRLGDEKAKEEKRLAKEAEKAGKSTLSKEKSAGANKDGDSSDSQNYQILRRATDDEPEGDVDEEANGAIVEDKAVKPQETVRDTSTKKVNGVESDASVSPVADSPENQGWSTVSKATKNRKGGNGGSRAIAS